MLIGISLTHNDKSKGWLKDWFETNKKCLDHWIILDDCSDDGTLKALREMAKGSDNILIEKTTEPTFETNENKIRELLWELTRKKAEKGDWIMVIDSDEILCPEFNDFYKNIEKRNDIGKIAFKKIEMWNDTHYRNDGLWSNYFIRLFPFIDEPWGYTGKGFHFPQIPAYAHLSSKIAFQSNVRIKHLSYMTTELRKAKYDFMTNNPQQKKDVTYYHLHSANDPINEIELKKYEDKPNLPTFGIIFICDYMFDFPKAFFKSLYNIDYPLDKIGYFFVTNECHLNVTNQIKDFEPETGLFSEFLLLNYPEDDWCRRVPRKSLILKKEALRLINDSKALKDFDKVDYWMICDGRYCLPKDVLNHHAVADKPFMAFRGNPMPYIIMRKNLLKRINIDEWGSHSRNDFEDLFVKFKDSILLWRTYLGCPYPINDNLIKQKYQTC